MTRKEIVGGLRYVRRQLSSDQPEVDQLQAVLDAACALLSAPDAPFDRAAADRLADEVAVLTLRGVLDQRSLVANALLDYRDPPVSPRTRQLFAERLPVPASILTDKERAAVTAACLVLESEYSNANSGYGSAAEVEHAAELRSLLTRDMGVVK